MSRSLATARAMGDRVALIDGPSGATTTYAELASRIDRAAAGLAARGLRPGDVLALWAPNSPEWAIAALGAMAAGATVSGVSPVAAERELAAQLMDSEASILATLPARLPRGARGRARRPACARSWRSATSRATARRPRSHSTRRAPSRCCPTRAARPACPRASCSPTPTSSAAVGQVRATLKLGARDTVVAIAPFAHVMGFVVTLSNALSLGCDGRDAAALRLRARSLELVERHRATVLVGPPPMMAALAGHPAVDAHDLSSLELIVSGGAPVPAEIARAVGERLPGAVVRLGYGLTETTATATAPDRELAVAPGSVGRAMPAPSCAWSTPRAAPTSAPASPASSGCAGRRRWPATCTVRTPPPR